MSRVKVYLSNISWAEPSAFINDSEYISLTNAARMINSYPVTIENAFINNGMPNSLFERPYSYTGSKARVSMFITLESFQWYLIMVLGWDKQLAEEAIAEVRSKAAAAMKKKQKKDEEEEEEEYVEEEEEQKNVLPPLRAARAARPKITTRAAAVDIAPPPRSGGGGGNIPPPWWKNLEGEIYPMTNPATFTGVLNSDQLKKRCNTDIDKQVKRKLASDFDAAKEAADMIPIIQKRLRESSAIRDRVQSEVATRCAWEKIRPFETEDAK
jgi:hypothetical protein